MHTVKRKLQRLQQDQLELAQTPGSQDVPASELVDMVMLISAEQGSVLTFYGTQPAWVCHTRASNHHWKQ